MSNNKIRIKKVSTVITNKAQVLNSYSDSPSDTYSIDYINQKIEELMNGGSN